MTFPVNRPRRLRRTGLLRNMVRETSLMTDDLIYPMFATFGKKKSEEIPSMPGVFRFTVDRIGKEAFEAEKLGIPAVILFGIPEKKDEKASGAYNKNGIIQQAIKAVRAGTKNLTIITDVCLCEYMSHGHCGIVRNGEVDNDATLDLLAGTALSHARAGADMVAPSDMMDGRVRAIRDALDKEGFSRTPIMSYAVKYASAFYGPFRDAAGSAPQFGDRKSYQMDPANAREALREAALDIEEGADIIMVKPALSYLDIITRVKKKFSVPVAAYNVSGEYAVIKAGAKLGWVDGEELMMEVLTSIKRAGADLILTYFAKDAARKLALIHSRE